MKDHELFLLKQKAVINMHKMELDKSLSFFSSLMVSERGRVMDTKHAPIWLDDDSRCLHIMGL